MDAESFETLGPPSTSEISELPRWAATALAARAAIRVMPFGPTEPREVVRGIEACNYLAMMAAVSATPPDRSLAERAQRIAAASEVPFEDTVAVTDTAQAARQALQSATVEPYRGAEGALHAARQVLERIGPSPEHPGIIASVTGRLDYDALRARSSATGAEEAVPRAFFERPLWSGDAEVEEWLMSVADRWGNALTGVQLPEVVDRYMSMIRGEVDWEGVEQVPRQWATSQNAQAGTPDDAQQGRKTYLLTWNGSDSSFPGLQERLEQVRKGEIQNNVYGFTNVAQDHFFIPL